MIAETERSPRGACADAAPCAARRAGRRIIVDHRRPAPRRRWPIAAPRAGARRRRARADALEALSVFYGDKAAVKRRLAASPPGRGARADRALGLRQDDAAALAQPPHRADRRARAAAARSCSTASDIDELEVTDLRRRVGDGLPAAQPVPDDDLRQRRLRAARAGARRRPAQAASSSRRWRGAASAPGLYDEVADDLDRPALRLSGGQQQRLCIARALAAGPRCCCWTSRARRSTRSPRRSSRS